MEVTDRTKIIWQVSAWCVPESAESSVAIAEGIWKREEIRSEMG